MWTKNLTLYSIYITLLVYIYCLYGACCYKYFIRHCSKDTSTTRSDFFHLVYAGLIWVQQWCWKLYYILHHFISSLLHIHFGGAVFFLQCLLLSSSLSTWFMLAPLKCLKILSNISVTTMLRMMTHPKASKFLWWCLYLAMAALMQYVRQLSEGVWGSVGWGTRTGRWLGRERRHLFTLKVKAIKIYLYVCTRCRPMHRLQILAQVNNSPI